MGSTKKSTKRVLGGIGAVAAAILVIAGLAAVVSRLRASGTSTPTLRAIETGSLVGVAANISFGSITIDGAKEEGTPPFFFNLGSTATTITYVAPPFRTQTCTVSWAANTDSSSPLNTSGSHCSGTSEVIDGSFGGKTLAASTSLFFWFTLGDLPVSLQASALGLLDRTILPVSQSASVPPGQYYATGRDTHGMILSHQDDTALTAQASLLLPTPQQLSAPTSWCHALICPLQFDYIDAYDVAHSAPPGKLWAVEIPLALDWRFSTADDQTVSVEYGSEDSSAIITNLVLDAHDIWHLAQSGLQDQIHHLSPTAFCDEGQTELTSALEYHQALQVQFGGYGISDHGLAGCELQIMHNMGRWPGE